MGSKCTMKVGAQMTRGVTCALHLALLGSKPEIKLKIFLKSLQANHGIEIVNSTMQRWHYDAWMPENDIHPRSDHTIFVGQITVVGSGLSDFCDFLLNNDRECIDMVFGGSYVGSYCFSLHGYAH